MRRKPNLTGKLAASEKWQRIGFALLSTLLILLLVKIPIKRYYLELQEGEVLHHSAYTTYLADDLDSDGNTERIYIYNSAEANRLTLMLHDADGDVRETISFIHHEWTPNSFPAVYDIDGDGVKEVLIVSLRNDSVFLNAVNLFTSEFAIDNFPIGAVERPVPQMAYGTRFFAFDDFNGDGSKELYFRFDAGYGLKPRGLYRIDIPQLKMFFTPESYIPWNAPEFKDLNRDGIPEVLAWSYAPSNVTFETEFTDNRAWIGAFNLEMDYLFPPIPMPAGYGYVYTSPAMFSDSMFFAIYSNRSSETIPNRIFLLDYHGNILNEKTVFQGDPTLYSQRLEIIDNKNFLLINTIGQFELTAALDNLPQKKIKRQGDYKPYLHLKSWPVDVNGDGTEELVFYHLSTSEIEILSDNYKRLASFQLPFERLRITNIFPYLVNGKTDRLMVATDSGYFFMQYIENPFFWTKYLIWLVVFIAAWGFTWLVQFFQRRRMEQKWESERQLTELQFNTIRNQLNPHFIFNALSSVGYLIENGKKEDAYDYLTINTRLIRKVLNDADLTTRTLSEEINFVKDYLKIQEFRFKDRFITIINIDQKVNMQMAVPKMVVHTYVENSVIHGFKHVQSGGIMEITINALPKGAEFIIKDNGKTVDSTQNFTQNNGKGIKIMESYYRIFEKQHRCRIDSSLIQDQKEEDGATGTTVIIKIEAL